MGGTFEFQVQDSFWNILLWRLGDLKNESHFLKKSYLQYIPDKRLHECNFQGVNNFLALLLDSNSRKVAGKRIIEGCDHSGNGAHFSTLIVININANNHQLFQRGLDLKEFFFFKLLNKLTTVKFGRSKKNTKFEKNLPQFIKMYVVVFSNFFQFLKVGFFMQGSPDFLQVFFHHYFLI